MKELGTYFITAVLLIVVACGLGAVEKDKAPQAEPSVSILQAEAKALRAKVERLQSQVDFLNKMLAQLQTERDTSADYNQKVQAEAVAKCGKKLWMVDVGVITCEADKVTVGDGNGKAVGGGNGKAQEK